MPNITLETAGKFIDLVAGLIPIYKIFLEVAENNKSRTREEFHLIKELIEQITSQHKSIFS